MKDILYIALRFCFMILQMIIIYKDHERLSGINYRNQLFSTKYVNEAQQKKYAIFNTPLHKFSLIIFYRCQL